LTPPRRNIPISIPSGPSRKSRHITVEQIRELERELYLRPFIAPLKVAVIFDAERMCLGSASAANAFLKTLEEPPAHHPHPPHSGRPAMLLPPSSRDVSGSSSA